MRVDLHVHSKYSKSDGVLEPEKILKLAKAKALDGIAITDHNTIKGGIEVRKIAKDLTVIVGAEIRTGNGEVIGLFLQEEIKQRNLFEVIEEIKSQGGLAIIPHPFDRMRKSSMIPSEKIAKHVDGVEIFNSRCISQKFNEFAKKFAEKNNLAITAGSDAHFGNEIGLAGVILEAQDEEEVRKFILKKRVEVFGKKSSIFNHVMSKGVKLWRKLTRYG